MTLTGQQGREITVEGDDVALCRCGSSARKPFRDASHRRTGPEGTSVPAARA